MLHIEKPVHHVPSCGNGSFTRNACARYRRAARKTIPPSAVSDGPDQGPEPQENLESNGGNQTDTRLNADYQLPREVISRLRDTVFGFDTFYVTSVENYQANGVLFKGNLRKDPSEAYLKMRTRLEAQLGTDYRIFLLEDQSSEPVVVVLPAAAVEPAQAPLPLLPVALLFAGCTLATTLNAAGVPLFAQALGVAVDLQDPVMRSNAILGTIAAVSIIAVHELGHLQSAKQEGVTLAPPLLIPAGLGILGSFGAVTGITSTLKDRAVLLKIAVSGPAAGAGLSFLLTIAGLILSSASIGPLVQVESGAFNDCLIMGILGQLVFGQQLINQPSVALSPILLAGWAGLVINGLNTIPIGELDGGRIAHAIWGRRAANRISTVLTLFLGLAGIIDSLALYWILLILTLQRGPISPQENELSAPSRQYLGIALLVLPILTLIPYPVDVTSPGF